MRLKALLIILICFFSFHSFSESRSKLLCLLSTVKAKFTPPKKVYEDRVWRSFAVELLRDSSGKLRDRKKKVLGLKEGLLDSGFKQVENSRFFIKGGVVISLNPFNKHVKVFFEDRHPVEQMSQGNKLVSITQNEDTGIVLFNFVKNIKKEKEHIFPKLTRKLRLMSIFFSVEGTSGENVFLSQSRVAAYPHQLKRVLVIKSQDGFRIFREPYGLNESRKNPLRWIDFKNKERSGAHLDEVWSDTNLELTFDKIKTLRVFKGNHGKDQMMVAFQSGDAFTFSPTIDKINGVALAYLTGSNIKLQNGMGIISDYFLHLKLKNSLLNETTRLRYTIGGEVHEIKPLFLLKKSQSRKVVRMSLFGLPDYFFDRESGLYPFEFLGLQITRLSDGMTRVFQY